MMNFEKLTRKSAFLIEATFLESSLFHLSHFKPLILTALSQKQSGNFDEILHEKHDWENMWYRNVYQDISNNFP